MGQVLLTTATLAGVTTLVLLLMATPLAWWLAHGRGPWREPIAALVTLPLILPPTVIGFYLLIALGPQSPLMALLHPFGVRTLAFTFQGLVIGSVIYSLPFAVQPLRQAFESIGARTLEAAATLRAAPLDRFFSLELPLARRGFLVAAVLVFAHTVGEFGVVLMIGGAIPGKTEVVSIEVWRLVEALDYAQAHRLSLALLIAAFAIMLAVALLSRRAARSLP